MNPTLISVLIIASGFQVAQVVGQVLSPAKTFTCLAAEVSTLFISICATSAPVWDIVACTKGSPLRRRTTSVTDPHTEKDERETTQQNGPNPLLIVPHIQDSAPGLLRLVYLVVERKYTQSSKSPC